MKGIQKRSNSLFFLLILPALVYGSVQTLFFVDPAKGSDSNSGISIKNPLKTIQHAQQLVRRQNGSMKNDIVVYLRKGVYQLSEPLLFSKKDGGTNGFTISYKAYRNEDVTICGSKTVSGWRLFDAKRNIYCAKLPSSFDSRQLFVGGIRAIRARSIGDEKRWIKSDTVGHLTSDLSLLKWKNPSDVECVYREIWTNPRCGIARMAQIGDTLLRLEMKQPGWKNCRNKGVTSARTPWYFENAYELLDDEGEWYLDKSGKVGGAPFTVYYKPRCWESISNEKVEMPILEKLIVVKGENVDNPVSHLTFEGLKFSYTTWLRPNTERGHSDAQNNVLRENKTNDGEFIADGAAITLQYAHKVVVLNCSFMHLGCAGINMYAGCQHNRVQGSLFYDLSGTGIQMGNYKNWKDTLSENGYDPQNKSCLLKDNQVLDNHIEQCGVEYRSSTGIAAAFPVDMVIKGNTIKNMPYSGMHIGWGWTTVPYTAMKNNLITNNFVENVMLELADGGAIYTLGENAKNEWSLITQNYMNRVMWGQCVYMDNGSSFYKITDNVYRNGDDYNVKINSGSHDISVSGIYSNKKKDLVGKVGCYNYQIDSTQFITPSNLNLVAKIGAAAGAKRFYPAIWNSLPNLKRYEAENADIEGSAYSTAGIGTHVFGYSGMGFLSGFDKGALSAASFTINVSNAKSYVMKLKYAAGKGWDRKLALVVNGKNLGILDIHNTQSKNNWAEFSNNVNLTIGLNTITFKMLDSNKEFLYLDNLTLMD